MTHIENLSLKEAIAYLLKHHSKRAVIQSALWMTQSPPKPNDVPEYLQKDLGLETAPKQTIKPQ